MRRAAIWIPLGVALCGTTGAEGGTLTLTRLSGPVVVDGSPGDAAWLAVAPLPLTQYAPVYRGAPAQRSEIRVASLHGDRQRLETDAAPGGGTLVRIEMPALTDDPRA
jgi:hypothetical protein